MERRTARPPSASAARKAPPPPARSKRAKTGKKSPLRKAPRPRLEESILRGPASAEAVEALASAAASLTDLTALVRRGGLAHATEAWVLETLLAMGHLLGDRRQKTEGAAERLVVALFGDRFDEEDRDDDEEDGDPGEAEAEGLGFMLDPGAVLGAADVRVAIHHHCDLLAAVVQGTKEPAVHHEAVAEIARVRAVVGPVKEPKAKKAH